MMQVMGRSMAVALLGLTLALSISGVYVALAFYLLFMAVSYTGQKKMIWKMSPLDIPLAVLFLWGIMFGSLKDHYQIVFFYLIVHLSADFEHEQLTRYFLIGAAIGGFWGVVQAGSGIVYNPTPNTYDVPRFFQGWPEWFIDNFSVRGGRATGSRSHPLTYAESLIPAFFIASRFCWQKKWLPWLGFVLTALGIFLSKGRAVWIGVLVGIIVYSFFIPLKKRLVVWAGLLLVVIGVGIVSPEVRGRALSTFSPQAGTVSDQQSKELRFYIWREALKVVQEHPLVGAEKVRLNFKEVEGYEDRVWSEAHSTYLQQAAQQGLIGLGILLWVLVAAFRTFLRGPEEWRGAFCATLIAFLIAGITESWITDSEVTMIFWSFVGAATRVCMGHVHET